MQYIQLQGQVAADLELPIVGSYNLFIDTSDNSIKAKDSDGHMHGGGGLSLTELTRDEIGNLVASASLTPGAFYKITNAATRSFYDNIGWGYAGYGNEIQNGGTTIILQATSDNTLSKKGIGLFHVPNHMSHSVWDDTHYLYYENKSGIFDHNEPVWVYSWNEDFQTSGTLVGNIGYNSLSFKYDDPNNRFFSNPNYTNGRITVTGQNTGATVDIVDWEYIAGYNEGDKVIYGGLVYVNKGNSNLGYATDGYATGPIDLNSADWEVVPYNDVDYNLVADTIEYEFAVDNISYRTDGINEVRSEFNYGMDNFGFNTIKFFPWGNPAIQHTKFINCYIYNLVNIHNSCYFRDIETETNSTFDAIYWGRYTKIERVKIGVYAQMTNLRMSYQTRIYDIVLKANARLDNIYFYHNDDNDRQLRYIIIEDAAQFSNYYDPTYLYSGARIDNLYIGGKSVVSDLNLYDGSNLQNVKLGENSYLYSISLGNGSSLYYLTLQSNAYFYSINAGTNTSIQNINMDNNSYLDYWGIGDDCYVQNINLETNSGMYCNNISDGSIIQNIHIEPNSSMYLIDTGVSSNFQNISIKPNSSINSVTTGLSSNFESINLDSNSYIYNIATGQYGYFGKINLGIDSNFYNVGTNGDTVGGQIYNINTGGNVAIYNIQVGNGTVVRQIDIAETAQLNNITLNYSDAYFQRVSIDINGGVNNVILQNAAQISDIQIGEDAGFGGFTVSSSVHLTNFDIQQNFGFGGTDITSSIDSVTMGRGYNNFRANEFEITGSTNVSYTPGDYQNSNATLDTSKSFHLIDITGQTDTRSWYLPNNGYEGQQVTFLLKNDGGDPTITPNQVMIFLDTIRDASGRIRTSVPWYPFSQQSNGGYWQNTGRAIWINGAWNIENGQWD